MIEEVEEGDAPAEGSKHSTVQMGAGARLQAFAEDGGLAAAQAEGDEEEAAGSGCCRGGGLAADTFETIHSGLGFQGGLAAAHHSRPFCCLQGCNKNVWPCSQCKSKEPLEWRAHLFLACLSSN